MEPHQNCLLSLILRQISVHRVSSVTARAFADDPDLTNDAADVYDAPPIACETHLVSDECTDTPSSLSGCPPTSTSA
ncbi:hypothetical protein BDZ89DRAFT_1140706 [Hymenopellis radicata]|nr:hypothetical protein BDZ89DRAFT_1140706 [Hymenopellis radicata]